MYFSDHKVYIQLYKKENDTYKYYNFNITEIADGGEIGSEEYIVICGNINSCTQISSDYILPNNDNKFGYFKPIHKKRKMIIKGNNNGHTQSK